VANNPRLLLADEPTGALDSRTSERVLALLRDIRDRHGMTMLIVSYDSAVASYADRSLNLLDGRLVTPPSEVSAGPAQPPAAGE
jgi:putative ABC transport system ATP-binding protein